MKSKGPAAAKAEEERKKGLALFGVRPPTPKLLRAFGGNFNKAMIERMKVKTLSLITAYKLIKISSLLHKLFLFPPTGSCCFWKVRRLMTPFWE